jgi:hypothetical protein
MCLGAQVIVRTPDKQCNRIRILPDPVLNQRKEVIMTITLSPSQSTTISSCLITSSLLQASFGTSNAQLQTIDSYLTGSASGSSTAGSSTTGDAAASPITASSLLGSLIDTLA